MVVGGCRRLWVVVGCWGWLWVVAYFSITHNTISLPRHEQEVCLMIY